MERKKVIQSSVTGYPSWKYPTRRRICGGLGAILMVLPGCAKVAVPGGMVEPHSIVNPNILRIPQNQPSQRLTFKMPMEPWEAIYTTNSPRPVTVAGSKTTAFAGPFKSRVLTAQQSHSLSRCVPMFVPNGNQPSGPWPTLPKSESKKCALNSPMSNTVGTWQSLATTESSLWAA